MENKKRKVTSFEYDGETISVFSDTLEGLEQKEKRWVLEALKVSGIKDYERIVSRVMRSNKVNYDVARAQIDNLVRFVKRESINRKFLRKKETPKKEIKPKIVEKKTKPNIVKKQPTKAEMELRRRATRIINNARHQGISIEIALERSGATPKVRKEVLRRRPR